MAYIINVVLIVLVLVFWIFIIRKLIWNKFAPVKTVRAEVIDKYMAGTASKYPGIFKPKRYIIVFATKEKKLSFSVSEFSYQNYKIGEKGTLKYKGNRIISF